MCTFHLWFHVLLQIHYEVDDLNRQLQAKKGDYGYNLQNAKMISEAFKLAKEDMVIIPLHQQPLSWAVRDGVNIIQHADNKIRLWYATIDWEQK